MKTFEEKWTAWLDGELSGDELAEFEASLPDKAAAEAEKRDAHKLGAFLKEQLQGRAMGNEEFFHHQLRERIAGDARAALVPERAGAKPALWPIGWFGLAPRLSRSFASAHFSSCARRVRPTNRSISRRS